VLHRGVELDGLVVCEFAFRHEFVYELFVERVVGEFQFVFIVGIVGLFVLVVVGEFVVFGVVGLGVDRDDNVGLDAFIGRPVAD